MNFSRISSQLPSILFKEWQRKWRKKSASLSAHQTYTILHDDCIISALKVWKTVNSIPSQRPKSKEYTNTKNHFQEKAKFKCISVFFRHSRHRFFFVSCFIPTECCKQFRCQWRRKNDFFCFVILLRVFTPFWKGKKEKKIFEKVFLWKKQIYSFVDVTKLVPWWCICTFSLFEIRYSTASKWRKK